MGSHYRGTDEELVALNAYIPLIRAAHSMERVATEHLRGAGLSVPQFGVLEALFHLGPLRQSELAGKLLCTAGNITAVLRGLEGEGLVERSAELRDRRCTRVTLSPKGEKLVARVLPDHVAALSRALHVLSTDELEKLRQLCTKLGRGSRSAAR